MIVHNYSWVGDKVEIGAGSKIEPFSFIPNGVVIGKNCFIGPACVFTNDKYPKAKGKWIQLDTIVEDDVSIGANSTILPGIVLRKGCRIAAHSVVTKDVEEGKLWLKK
jgi:acetyltransferase-like isoleucine patch superfamily enzyme